MRGYRTFSVVQSSYYPTLSDYEVDFDINKPLVVVANCVDRRLEKHTLFIYGTEPRFWVKQDPYDVLPKRIIRHCVTKIEVQGKTIDGEQLYCVYLKYPFFVTTARRFFKWHGQADIVYREAWKLFYGIKCTFRVKTTALQDIGNGRYNVHIKDLEAVEDEYLPTRDYYLDIEQGKYINRITLLERATGDIYHFSTRPVGKDRIERMLRDKEWLSAHVAKRSAETCEDWLWHNSNGAESVADVEPLHGNIYVTVARDPTPDEYPQGFEDEFRERQLIEWFMKMKRKLGVQVLIAHYIDYDCGELREVPKRRNILIKKWNKKHPHDVKRMYYPYVDLKDCQLFDIMSAYMHLHDGEMEASGRIALSFMGMETLGYGKLLLPKEGHEWTEAHEPDFYSAYNIFDCVIPWRVDMAKGVLQFHKSLASFSGVGLDYTLKHMVMAETYLMHEFKPYDIIMPSIIHVEPFAIDKFEGGYVKDPFTGIADNVLILDITTSYPNEIITQNIGPTTLIKDICSICENQCKSSKSRVDGCNFAPSIKVSINPGGNVFTLEHTSILSAILDRLSRVRNELKARGDDDKQRTVKFFSNSFYGVFASDSEKRPFRLQSRLIAENITRGARAHIMWTERVIENCEIDGARFSVIYIDTDSCFVVIKDTEYTVQDLHTIADKLVEHVNKSYDEFAKSTFGVSKHTFNIKFEGVYKRFCQYGRKKHYVYMTEDGALKFKGLKVRRSDSSKFQKCVLRVMFKKIMIDGVSVIGLRDFFADVIARLRAGEYDSGTGIPKAIKSEGNIFKPILDYANAHLGKSHEIGDTKLVMYYISEMRDGYPPPPTMKDGTMILGIEWDEDVHDYAKSLNYDAIIERQLDTKTMNNILSIFAALDGKHKFKQLLALEDNYSRRTTLDEWF